jgi:hypothetical protein
MRERERIIRRRMMRSRGRERSDENIAKEEKKENKKATENMEKGSKTKSENR